MSACPSIHLDGLVLIDGPAGATTEDERRNYRDFIEQLEAIEHPSEALTHRVAERVTSETTQEERFDLVEHWFRWWRTYRAPAIVAEYRSWYDRDGVLDRPSEIRVSTLCVHGEEDILKVERARETADEVSDGSLAVIPESGHLSNLERPVVVNDALCDFLVEVHRK